MKVSDYFVMIESELDFGTELTDETLERLVRIVMTKARGKHAPAIVREDIKRAYYALFG